MSITPIVSTLRRERSLTDADLRQIPLKGLLFGVSLGISMWAALAILTIALHDFSAMQVNSKTQEADLGAAPNGFRTIPNRQLEDTERSMGSTRDGHC